MIDPPRPSRGAPDLVVASPSLSDSGPADGPSLTLSATVRNAGDGASPATTLRFYRSTDTTITTADTAVGAEAVPGLAASGSDSASVDLTALSSPGTYYYGACIDAVAGESDTTNNCSASVQVTVQGTQPPEQETPPPEQDTPEQGNPDLTFQVVAIASGPSGFASGGNFLMIAIILNVGDGASAATTLRYFRSTDATLTTSDTQVGTDAVPGLAASEFSRQTLDVTLPSSHGTYYYGVCVDAVAGETNTSNNCSMGGRVVVPSTPPQKRVEITPREVTLAALGDTAALTARVLDAEGNVISGEAVSWNSLNPDVATVDAAGVVTAVANGIAGVTASASGARTGLARVTVALQSDQGNPDLEIPFIGTTTVVGNTYPLESFQVGASVRNNGDGPSEVTTLRIYRSVDTTVDTSDTQVGTASVAGLAASENASTTIRVRSPLSPGTYYYGACVDAVAGESDTTNNCGGSVAVPVVPRGQPDLVVQTPSLNPPFPTAGATFTLTATVWNFAQVVDGTSEATTLRIYRSVDTTVDTSDTQVGTDTVPALGPRGRSTQSVDLTAPSTPGTYYYAACVDAVTDESDTTNNCSNRLTVHVREP